MRRRDSRIPRTLQIAAAFEGEKIGHAAGDIVRFRGDGSPLRALTLSIDPIQDLHGYDAPWPGGGGVNLFNIDRTEGTPIPDDKPASTSPRVMDTMHYFVGVTRNNYYDKTRVLAFSINGTEISLSVDGGGYGIGFPVAVVAQETYTLSFTNTSNGKISIGYYDADWNYLSEKDGSSYPYTFTTPASCAYAVLVITVISVSSPASLKNIQLKLGSSVAPYAPYSNICPISGWDGAQVWRTGRNLVPSRNVSRTDGDVQFTRNADGSVTAVGTASRNCWWHSGSSVTDWTFLRAGQYRLTGGISSDRRLYIIGVYVDGTAINNNTVTGGVYDIGRGLTFSLTKDAYITYQIQINSGTEVDDTFYPMISRDTSAVASDFTPYTGTTIPVTWSEAGTVYGGEWDVIGGVLKKTWGMAILANRTWTMETTANGNVFSCNLLPDKAKSYNQMCSKYKAVNNYRNYLKNGEMGTYNATNGRNRVSICDNAYSTVSDFVNGLAGVDYIYELATPLEYTLTPQQLDTLAGQNVVWGDAGATEVEYVHDNGVEGGKLALLLRNKPELLIAMRKGAPTQELLLAMGGRGDAKPSITPLKPLEEKKDEDEEAMRK